MFFTLLITAFVLSAVSIFLFLHQRSKRLKEEILSRNIPYAQQPSFLRIMLFKERLELKQVEIIKKVGTIYGFDMQGGINLVVAVPELIQIVLNKEFSNFPNRRQISSNDPFFSNALSVVELEKWKRLRAIVAPTFATGKLKKMKPCLDGICQTLMNNIDNSIQNNINEINIKKYAGCFTMDTIIQVAFGSKVDSLVDKNNIIIKNAQKMFSVDISVKNMMVFALMFFGPKFIQDIFKNFLRLNAEVVDFFGEFATKIIEEKRKEFKGKDFTKASNFIEFLLEAEHELEMHKGKFQDSNGVEQINGIDNNENNKAIKYITNAEMISQCVLFFLAGFDTTATIITLSSYFLALNPDKQQKAYESICDVLSENDYDPNEKDVLEKIPFEFYQNKFEYINGCVSETLRMTPPAPFIERRCMNDCKLESNDGKYKLFVKKNDIVQIPVWYLHYNEKYFPEPEKYKPERFCGEQTFPNYAYLPFGSGPRACVARSLALLEAKMALVWLVKNYKFDKCDKTNIPIKYYNQGGFLTPRDIILNVEHRK